VAARPVNGHDYRLSSSRSAEVVGTMVQEDCRAVTLEHAAPQIVMETLESAGVPLQSPAHAEDAHGC
jgi:hypothetical protein